MEYSHGKDVTYIRNAEVEVIEFVKSKGKEIRFSSEDSFRSDLVDLLSIYSALDKIGVTESVSPIQWGASLRPCLYAEGSSGEISKHTSTMTQVAL